MAQNCRVWNMEWFLIGASYMFIVIQLQVNQNDLSITGPFFIPIKSTLAINDSWSTIENVLILHP